MLDAICDHAQFVWPYSDFDSIVNNSFDTDEDAKAHLALRSDERQMAEDRNSFIMKSAARRKFTLMLNETFYYAIGTREDGTFDN